MNDKSRALRHELGSLCDHYNAMLADKDTLDIRFGFTSRTNTGSMPAGGAKRAYEDASESASVDLRQLVVQIVEIGQRIRTIESF